MEHLLLIIIGILLLIIFVLLAKVYFLRKSAQEISEAFRDRLTADTNTLIDISTRDPYMRQLAADINMQLRLLLSVPGHRLSICAAASEAVEAAC